MIRQDLTDAVVMPSTMIVTQIVIDIVRSQFYLSSAIDLKVISLYIENDLVYLLLLELHLYTVLK